MSQPTRVVKLKNKRSKSGIKFLYYFAKCFGLAPFTLGENNEIFFKSVYEILYPTFVIGFCISYFNYFARNKFNADVEILSFSARIVRVLLDLLTCLSLLSSPLMLLLRRREIEEIVNSFKKCDKVLDHFGVNEDREKRSITVTFVAAIPLFVILIIDTTKLIGQWEDFKIPLTYFDVGKIVAKIWIAYVEHIGIFLFFIIVLEVEQRFQRIKEILPEISAPGYELAPEESDIIEQNRMELDSGEEFIGTHDETSGAMESSLTLSRNITNLAMVYDDLIDIVEKIMKLFSLQIICIISHHFLIITALYYNTFVIVKTFTFPKRLEDVLMFFYTSLYITIMIFELFNIGRVCQKIQMMQKSTTEVINKVWIKYRRSELKFPLQMFSLQLLQRPLKIAAFGFFALDYSYLYKMLCTVVAYLVVMVQLDSSRGKVVQKLLNQTGLNVTNE